MNPRTILTASLLSLASVSPSRSATFEDWRLVYFNSTQLADSSISGWDADPDHDGIRNYVEFAIGTDPWQPSPGALLAPQLVDDGNGVRLEATYQRSISAEHLVFLPQVAEELTGWWRADQVTATGGTIIDYIEYITAHDALYLGGPQKRFMRLLIAQDSDDDGLPDDYELALGLDPFTLGDGLFTDADGDGDTDMEEFLHGTDPLNPNDNSRKQRVPRAPVNVHMRRNSDNTVDIIWDDVSDNEEFFVIYKTDTLTGQKTEVGRVGPNNRVFRLPANP